MTNSICGGGQTSSLSLAWPFVVWRVGLFGRLQLRDLQNMVAAADLAGAHLLVDPDTYQDVLETSGRVSQLVKRVRVVQSAPSGFLFASLKMMSAADRISCMH